MIVHWHILIVAVILLWIPRQWLRFGRSFFGRRRRRVSDEPWRTREPGDPRLSLRMEFAKSRNYVDLLRAAAGSVAFSGIMNLESCFALGEGATRGAGLRLLAARSVLLLVGLLIQTIRYENRRVTLFPPVFYLAGLSVGLCASWGALFAFLLVWAMNPLFPNASVFLTVYAGLMFGFELLFGGINAELLAAALFPCLVPVLLSLLARRPLAVFGRRGIRLEGGRS